MANQEIALIFYEMAKYYQMNDTPFKPQAYEKAAMTLESMAEDVGEIYKKGGIKELKKFPGIGESMAEKIEEYLKTGRIKEIEKFRKKIPANINELTSIEGVGPKMAKLLYKKLKITNIQGLEKAAREGKIKSLAGFREKTERNILQGIAFIKRSQGRFLLGQIYPVVEEICEKLRELPELEEISPAGSVRRMRETIGDVDLLAVSRNPKKIMDFFCTLPGILKILGKGETKSSIRLKRGFDVDLRVVPRESYGSALQYFTGSKEHNIVTRKIAIDKGLKLNEYGIFRERKRIAGRTEKEVYKALGMSYVDPEIRENQGEIEASQKSFKSKQKLPRLIGYGDILGDLHVHSNWDGGADSIEKLAEEAIKMGYEYLGISDHTKFLAIEHGLDERQLEKRGEEIKKINEKFRKKNIDFRVLAGCEANIMADGSIDISDEALEKLDYVIAGVHSQLRMPREEMTKRIIRAMENPHVDMISHPTGRLIQRREEYQIDLEEILRVAKKTGTVLEINSFPDRLDLKDINIRKAKSAGVKMVINTDSHHFNQMSYMKYGIAQARRGWLEKKDVINVWPVENFLESLK